MKLYYMAGSCALVSHIVLEWIGKPFQTQAVSRKELKEPAFLALNPLGSVPAFMDGDMLLTQSVAILEYLAESAPEKNLLGATAQQRAETRRALSFLNSDVHKNFGVMFGIQGYTQNEAAQQEVKENTAKRLRGYFELLDKQLEGKDWLTGTRSIADPYLYVVMRWAPLQKIDLSDLSNLQRFFKNMEADAGVQAALKGEGLA